MWTIGPLQLFHSKSQSSAVMKNSPVVLIILVSLLLLGPGAFGILTLDKVVPESKNLSVKISVTSAENKSDQILVDLNKSKDSQNFSQIIIGRQSRSTGWLWNSSSTAENSNSSGIVQFEGEDNGEASSRSPRTVFQGKQVHEDALNVESVQPRGYFTFLPFTTSPAPPPTVPTLSNACTCVPYYRCDEGQVVTDGTGVIDIRYGWACNSVLEVCCRNPRPVTIPPTPVPTTSPVTALPGFTPQCGTLNPNGINARILGFKDSETQYGEYPWMSAILESKLVRGKWVLQFLCGASLITPRILITAAHCLKGKRVEHLLIRLGEWDTKSIDEFYPYQDIKVMEFVIHPQYYGGGLYNDIAIVFMKNSAILGPSVDTICLPEVVPEYDPTACWATGWGKNAFGANGQYQSILREVELGITPSGECQAALRGTNLGTKFNLHPSFICAGGLKGLDTCIGDGGGPLVCPSLIDPWRYILVGATSWGVNCGTYGVPGVYTDVSKFRQWIDSVISQRYPFYNPSRWTISGSATKVAQPQQSG